MNMKVYLPLRDRPFHLHLYQIYLQEGGCRVLPHDAGIRIFTISL